MFELSMCRMNLTSPATLRVLKEQFSPISSDPEIQQAGVEIDRLLGLPPDGTLRFVRLGGVVRCGLRIHRVTPVVSSLVCLRLVHNV